MSELANDLDMAERSAAEASQRSNEPFSNFGRLQLDYPEFPIVYKVWKEHPDRTRYAEEITEAVYRNTDPKQSFMEVNFVVHIDEFNPELTFKYHRRVSIISGKSDWEKIVKPSIQEAFGEGTTLGQINGRYVEVIDVPQWKFRNAKDDEEIYNTVKFVRAFNSREECLAAYEEKRGSQTQSSSGAPVSTDHPSIYPVDVWYSKIVPVIKTEHQSGESVASLATKYGVAEKYILQAVNG